jgi:membrane protein required for colicin V production
MFWLDILIVIGALAAAWFGYKKGFLIEILSLLAIMCAFAVAWSLSSKLVLFIAEFLKWNSKFLMIFAFVIVVLVVSYSMYWASVLFTRIVHKSAVGTLDKIFGAVFSVFKWVFMFSLVLWFLNAIQSSWYQEQKQKSSMLTHCEGLAPKLFSWFRVVVPFEDVFKEIEKKIS